MIHCRNLNEYARDARETAVAHGFSFADVPTRIALIHSELSEALEEHRNGHPAHELYFGLDGKPEGVPAEMADVLIRVFDFCGALNIDIEAAVEGKMEYNKGRTFMHGGKLL